MNVLATSSIIHTVSQEKKKQLFFYLEPYAVACSTTALKFSSLFFAHKHVNTYLCSHKTI